ncbi:ABC transporter substrate-binding protein [Bremerella sp. JC770]|uniref:siderophore ABC transporter substrate-binding protein n=1 Tax=Bremerella sp. JC770 TaxID=3232137 RepID=UPI00345ABB40
MNCYVKTITCLLIIATFTQSHWVPGARAEDSREFTHAQGTTHIPEVPKRVVVMDLAALDTLDALQIPVIGVPTMDKDRDWPEYLQKYTRDEFTKCGSLFEPDLAVIQALNPDLIIVGGRSSRQLDSLVKIAPTIDLSTSTSSFIPSMARNILTLGAIFDVEPKASQRSLKLLNDVRALHEKSSMQGKGLVLFSVNDRVLPNEPATRWGVVYELIGIDTVVTSGELPERRRRVSGSEESAEKSPEQVAAEEALAKKQAEEAEQSFRKILARRPEWIFVIDRNSAFGDRPNSESVLETNPNITDSTAWKSGQVVHLNGVGWYLIGGGVQQVENTIAQISQAFSAKDNPATK